MQLGAPSGLDSGSSRTFYIDNFESRRENSIGFDLDVPTGDLIFSDGFESGNLDAWYDAQIDGGDLSVSASAAVEGNYGLQAGIDDTTLLYVEDLSPMDETHYRARFYLDPNSLAMATSDRLVLLMDNGSVFDVSLGRMAGAYVITAGIKDDGGSLTSTTTYEISDDWHGVEIEWAAASSAGADDGYLKLWIDGVLQETVGGIDNDTRRVKSVQLGAVEGLDAGTSGTFYLDAFASRRQEAIGLLAV